jgi:peroxiredoxin
MEGHIEKCNLKGQVKLDDEVVATFPNMDTPICLGLAEMLLDRASRKSVVVTMFMYNTYNSKQRQQCSQTVIPVVATGA